MADRLLKALNENLFENLVIVDLSAARRHPLRELLCIALAPQSMVECSALTWHRSRQ